MTNDDIEKIYKSSVSVSHFAGLRAVYDAGYIAAAATLAGTGDSSMSQAAPTANVPIQTP